MEIKGSVLIIENQRIALPEIQLDAALKVWKVPTDYRDSGYFVSVKLPGQPDEIPACAPADAEYLGELVYQAPEANKVAAAKVARLQVVNAACDAALADLTATYPAGELQSWAQQVQEAAALKLAPPGDTPLLDAIAEARGLAVEDLAQRVRDKAAVFAAISGSLIGRRQAAEDALSAAQTLDDVEAVQW